MELTENKFTLDWFKERAINSIYKIEDGVFDFSDSLLMYIPDSGAEDEYEEVQTEGGPYYDLVTAPEREYLKRMAEVIVSQLPNHFEYIDLGPGTAKKEQILFDEITRQGKTCVYRPVDISKRYLDGACSHASAQGIVVNPLQASFEELPELLKRSEVPRFVSIGLTYSNYHPSEILNLLHSILGEEGYAFINSQLRERIDLVQLVEIYREVAFEMAKSKLALLGLKEEQISADYIYTNDGVELWYTVQALTPALSSKGVKVGDRLLLFQSLRPSKLKLEQDLADSRFDETQTLDDGATFVGALLIKKDEAKELDGLRTRFTRNVKSVGD